MQENYYRLLDVPFTAGRKDITHAYRTLMRRWHPDQFRGSDKSLAESYSRQLNLAYSVLSDPKKREDYDRSIQVEALQSQIMERYVAGYGGWNRSGSGPMPADAPRRRMTARERAEIRISDRNASLSVVVIFGMMLVVGLLLLLVFSLVQSAIGAFF